MHLPRHIHEVYTHTTSPPDMPTLLFIFIAFAAAFASKTLWTILSLCRVGLLAFVCLCSILIVFADFFLLFSLADSCRPSQAHRNQSNEGEEEAIQLAGRTTITSQIGARLSQWNHVRCQGLSSCSSISMPTEHMIVSCCLMLLLLSLPKFFHSLSVMIMWHGQPHASRLCSLCAR